MNVQIVDFKFPMCPENLSDKSIVFHGTGMIKHASFLKKFKQGVTYRQARLRLKGAGSWNTQAQQDEIISFLRDEGLIVEQTGHWLTQAIKKQ